MRKHIIYALGGVAMPDHNKAVAARDNYEVLYNQQRERSERLQNGLDEMEAQFLQAAAQAEALLMSLNSAEKNLERVEEERANASAGWNSEIQNRYDVDAKLTDTERRIAELNTLIAKESDRTKIEFIVAGAENTLHPGSKTPLSLVMTVGEVGQTCLRTLTYSKANRQKLEGIARFANGLVS